MEEVKDTPIEGDKKENEFDASKFNSVDEPPAQAPVLDVDAKKPNDADTDHLEKTPVVDKADDTKQPEATKDDDKSDDGFSWDTLANENGDDNDNKDNDNLDGVVDNDNPDNDNPNPDSDKKTDEPPADKKQPDTQDVKVEINDDTFKALAEQIGLNAESKDDFVKKLKDLEAENERLKQNQGNGVKESEKVAKYKKLRNLDDEELVKADLTAQGFTEQELTETIDVLKDKGTIKLEATKIRKAIDRGIDKEQQLQAQEIKDQEAKLQNDRKEGAQKLKTHLDNSDTMFGFKMASDEDKLPAVRKEHHEYIVSGDFLKDVTKDESSLAEAAWIWKNRNVIMNALKSRGQNMGRRDVLDDIGVPDTDKAVRVKDPTGESDEFNPSLWGSKDTMG